MSPLMRIKKIHVQKRNFSHQLSSIIEQKNCEKKNQQTPKNYETEFGPPKKILTKCRELRPNGIQITNSQLIIFNSVSLVV